MKTTKTAKLSTRARALLEQLKRRDLDYGAVELATYRELRTAGLATVIFSARGHWVFATSAGRLA